MTFDVDKYLFKKFHPYDYNCWHLLIDCVKDFHGINLPDYTPKFLIDNQNVKDQFTEERINTFQKVHKSNKENGLIVLMQHKILIPHVGFLYDNKILSMKTSGPTYENILNASRGFKTLEYYKCKL